MKLKQLIRYVDGIRDNAFSDEIKTVWLNEVEGLVQTEILLMDPVDVVTYSWPQDQETELMVQAPHDKLYWPYLVAKIDFANGEYNRYQNAMEMFNEHYGEYMRWCAARRES